LFSVRICCIDVPARKTPTPRKTRATHTTAAISPETSLPGIAAVTLAKRVIPFDSFDAIFYALKENAIILAFLYVVFV
jgi:hypothetical protein